MKLNQTEVRKRKPKVCWPGISILFFHLQTDYIFLTVIISVLSKVLLSSINSAPSSQRRELRFIFNMLSFLIPIRFFLHDSKLKRLFSVT